MVSDSNTHGVNDYRLRVLQSMFTSRNHRVHRIKNVLTITFNDLKVFKSCEVITNKFIGSLIALRNRNSVTVILEYKNNWKFFVGSTVNCFINVSFRNRRLTLRRNRYTFVLVVFHPTSNTCCVKSMVTSTRRNVMNIPLRFSKVVRHVTTARSDISCL